MLLLLSSLLHELLHVQVPIVLKDSEHRVVSEVDKLELLRLDELTALARGSTATLVSIQWKGDAGHGPRIKMHDELLNTVLDDCEDASHQGRVVFCICHVLIRV